MPTQSSGGKRKGAMGARNKSAKTPSHAAKPRATKGAASDVAEANAAGASGATVHPFESDPADHCETPLRAYAHLSPFLHQLARHLKKSAADLLIYDPYFCEGSMKAHLGKLGFSNVYNENEDFYQVIASAAVPDYDILVTSPPYSRDHMQKVAEFCASSGKPWAMLLPSFVHRKQYWTRAMPDMSSMAWVLPSERYHYWSICGGRQHNMQVCRHWLRDGKCSYGAGCAFLHPDIASGDGGVEGYRAPADVPAGTPAEQAVAPHALSPYHSLWHIHIPSKPCAKAVQGFKEKGATAVASVAELTRALESDKAKPPKYAHTRPPVLQPEEKVSEEKARAAERERVRLKRMAADAARRERAKVARTLERVAP